MSITADMSSNLALEGDTVVSPPDLTLQLERRESKALSISSLSNESQNSVAKAVATEACRDVERELEAIETRLSAFQGRRLRNDSESTSQNAVAPLQSTIEDKSDKDEHASTASNASSQIFSKLSKAQQEAGAVADQVASTLMKCDQLLQRVKYGDASRVSSISSTRERSVRARSKTRQLTSSRHSESVLSDSMASNASSPVWNVSNTVAIDDEETVLSQKAAAVKRFAARCQRDIETSTTKIELHHQQMQSAYMKELQRKYDSKKHMTLMTLREKYEKETKALVKAKMEEYELEEVAAVKKTRATLLEERIRVLEELQNSHIVALEESLSHLEMQLTTETDREKRELSSQLQEELNLTLKQIQDENRKSMERWEVEQRQKMEQELYDHREAAVASVLKAQEERTAVLKQEIQASHVEKEETELQKLKKALAFGAQAQLQQLRKRLEVEHEEKVNDIKAEASLALEKETEKLTQMLTQSHREQQEQLQCDLDKNNRVKIMELHDTLQASHQKNLQALKDAAEQHRVDALVAHRQDFEEECRQELKLLEKTLEQETSTKLHQLEMQHADECELKLEQLRTRAVNQHARELEAKRSRMIQCKNVLLAEATAFMSFDNNLSKSSLDDQGVRSKSNPEDNSAASHLLELKKHLSKELAQYVDVMVAEFDELAEEQHILVAKITESTQLYLSYKRQCGVLEAQSEELSNGLEMLHDQLQQKDAVCKKLYEANEALLKRLQTPALQASKDATKSESPSQSVKRSPMQAKQNTSKLETSKAWRIVDQVMIQRSALPSINGKGDAQNVRPTLSTAVGGRQAFGMIPKSAGAASGVRHTRHSEIAVTSSWQPHENQTQRPTSTNVVSRSVSTERMAVRIFASEHDSHHQQNSRSKEHESDSRDDVQQLRDENAIFRHENDLLRSKLVEKMRGRSKVVAGGQFRAASASAVAKVPVVPSSGCTKCSTARMKSIKAHQETDQAQATIAELQNYVDKIEAAQQRLWEERSTFVNDIAQLRDKLAEKVEECVLIQVECTKLDKQVNALQLKSDLAEYLTQQPVDKEVVDNAVQCSLQESSVEGINTDAEGLKAEVQLLIQQLDERDQELKRVSKELEGAQQSIKLEKEQREQETRLWNHDSTEHKRQMLELEQTEKKLRVYVQDLQRCHQKDVQIIEKANQQLREDIVAKEAAMQTLSQDKLESSAREQKLKMVVKELKVRNEQKVGDVDRLLAMIAVEKSANVAMKNQIRDLEEQVETLTKENAELSASTFLQQQESVDRVRNESDKLLREGQAEQLRLTEALNAAERDNQSLQTRISEVEVELAEQDELMQRQKRSHARAMERLLESSLRLCVVAPTVNVQLNTNGASILNKSSNVSMEKVMQGNDSEELTSVMCRSAPQQDSIKQVIENDVLPLFTSVFLQGDDNASPQADVSMTHWLQNLLHDMQARIAIQLESIYSTSSGNPGE